MAGNVTPSITPLEWPVQRPQNGLCKRRLERLRLVQTHGTTGRNGGRRPFSLSKLARVRVGISSEELSPMAHGLDVALPGRPPAWPCRPPKGTMAVARPATKLNVHWVSGLCRGKYHTGRRRQYHTAQWRGAVLRDGCMVTMAPSVAGAVLKDGDPNRV
jgi:hypothetical protein